MRKDIAILGAGPAGMAAAAQAAELGLSVTILDEQSAAGGQIYRDVDRAAQIRGDILGADYSEGQRLTKALVQDGIEHIAGATVWSIEEQFDIAYTKSGAAAQLSADHLILATGALERPMPIKGWTLPGVMTAGAGQILLKQSGLVAQRAVLVGSGPLLYLLASQMIRAGTPPAALIETQSVQNMIQAAPHITGALRGWRYLLKGAKMLNDIRRAGVRRYTGASKITIDGDTKAKAVRFEHKGQEITVSCDTIYLHHGVVPNTQVARALGVKHTWTAQQVSFAPQCDDEGRTNIQGIWIAGDSAGISGAAAAEYAGRLSALSVAHQMGRLTDSDFEQKARPLRRALNRERAARPFLDLAYPPYAEALLPEDDVIVCRCEEVRAQDVRAYAKLGCRGPNQTKAFGRVGMGPCQGRYCGLTVTQILAQEHDQTPDETGYYRIRAPLKPVTLGELAALHQNSPSQQGQSHD